MKKIFIALLALVSFGLNGFCFQYFSVGSLPVAKAMSVESQESVHNQSMHDHDMLGNQMPKGQLGTQDLAQMNCCIGVNLHQKDVDSKIQSTSGLIAVPVVARNFDLNLNLERPFLYIHVVEAYKAPPSLAGIIVKKE